MNAKKEYVTITLKGSRGNYEVEWDQTVSECRYCGEEIGLGHTAKDKWVPFDPPTDSDAEDEPCDVHLDTCAGR